MPDETGAITAGLDDVSAAGGTPVLSDRAKMLAIGATSQPNFGSSSGAAPDAPDIGGGPDAPTEALYQVEAEWMWGFQSGRQFQAYSVGR
jgi:hypothetical protein